MPQLFSVCFIRKVFQIGERPKNFLFRIHINAKSWVFSNVSDPHHGGSDPDPGCHFDVDSDPACHFGADPDPAPSFQIKTQNFEKVLQ